MINGQVPVDKWLETEYGLIKYCSTRWHQLPVKLLWDSAKAIRHNDCIHLNSIFYFPSVILAIISLFYKKPIVWSCRGNLEPAAMKISKWKKNPIIILIRYLLSSKLITFHATSASEVAQLKYYLGKAVKVVEIPNYMELPVCHPRKETNPYLLFVGRIHPIKGLDNLIKALPLSTKFMRSEGKLLLVGEGAAGYKKYLFEIVKSLGLTHRVLFYGHIEGEEKEILFANAYCSILPSHAENFGNVVIESLAQGTPVIASKGTPWVLVEETKSGRWVNNTPEELAGAIDYFWGLPPNIYDVYRNNALQLAKNNFDIHRNVGTWEHFYQHLIIS